MQKLPEPPRVAIVVSQLGYGGAERQTVELLRELRGTAWAPASVICLSEDVTAYGGIVEELGYKLAVIPRAHGFDLRRFVALRRQLQSDRIRIVHAVNWLAAAYALLAAPRGAVVVSSIRNSRLPAGRLRRFLLARLMRRSAAILVNSEEGRRLVGNECWVRNDRVTLVANGVDVERVRRSGVPGDFRRELQIPQAAPIVAYVGRNARVKNIPRLLAVARKLLTSQPELHIVIAGEGLDRAVVMGTELERAPRLHCVGSRRDIPSLLCDASVLLLTSDSEGMPNVVLEALAAGVPVVSTAVGDLSRILPSNCGALVPADSDQLATAVLGVLASDLSCRPALELQARHIASAYSVATMASATAAVWKSVAPTTASAEETELRPLVTP